MAEADDFVEAEGKIHLLSPVLPEFTLCGDAFDLDSDIDGYEQKATRRRKVTCHLCAMVVRHCSGVRTAPIQDDE